MTEPAPPTSAAGAHLDLRGRLSYGEYLTLDEVLGAQRPRTTAHDELLFIIQHQATELWLKLVLHELHTVAALIDADNLGPAFKSLARVDQVLRVLVSSWDVLTTMTPADYLAFRNDLDTASGFQSYQYRELEYLLGNKDPIYLRPFEHVPAVAAHLRAVMDAPSLYDRAVRLLGRRGLPTDASVVEAWRLVYTDPATHWDLYELAEELLDLEDALRQWRLRHVTTVERIIGGKPGTGGTSGVAYLRERLDVVLFPDLWQVRTEL